MQSILETEKISKLLKQFTIPSILALLVNSLYNIVDQIFIGNSLGHLGNAATNVSFPFITIFLSIALAIGNGGAAYFSISLGKKENNFAQKIVINSIIMLILSAILLFTITKIFFIDMLYLFGATENSINYAIDYTNIILYFLPLALFTSGFNSFIRADGSPKYAMYSSFIGAIINTILDPIFIFNFNMGIKGAAIATVLSQTISFIFTLIYINKFKMIDFNFKILFKNLNTIDFKLMIKIFGFGFSNFSIQIIFTIVQIVFNNVMRYYGSNSIYGADIPISSIGIMIKVSSIILSFIIGISLGAQPILGYNYGAKKYKRVIQTYKLAVISASIVAFTGFMLFIFFTKYIVIIFGKGDDLYMEFIYMTFRIYLSFFFLTGFQIISSNFFQATGYPLTSTILILTRQALFTIPLLIILPIFFGIKGALFAGPIADILSFSVTFIVISRKIKDLKNKIQFNE